MSQDVVPKVWIVLFKVKVIGSDNKVSDSMSRASASGKMYGNQTPSPPTPPPTHTHTHTHTQQIKQERASQILGGRREGLAELKVLIVVTFNDL